MKVLKIELLVIDFDDMGSDEIVQCIENVKYPNYCISPRVMGVQESSVDWTDEHLLNNTNTQLAEYNRLFKDL